MFARILGTGAAAVLFSLSMTSLHAADVTFAGKTIQIVVNFAAGGPSDIFARHYQTHLERRLPGNPSIIVENRTGASGLVGANYIYNVARPDGLTIGSLTAIAAQGILGGPSVRFDVTKFRWIGAVPQTQVILVRTDIGVVEPRDLLNPAKPLIYGNTGVNANYLNTRLFLDLIGASFKPVSGYRGQSDVIQAMRQGESSITDLGISGYLPHRDTYQREGLMIPIVQRGMLSEDGTFHRLAALSDLPTMAEVIADIRPQALTTPEFAALRALVGTYGVQFAFVLPPKTPQAVVDVLSAGFVATFRDPTVMEEAKARFKVEHEFVDGPRSQRYIEKLFADYAANPTVAKVIQAMAPRQPSDTKGAKGN